MKGWAGGLDGYLRAGGRDGDGVTSIASGVGGLSPGGGGPTKHNPQTLNSPASTKVPR